MADLTDNPRPDEDSLVSLDHIAGRIATHRDAISQQVPTCPEDFRVSLARDYLAASKAADSVDPGQWWGKLEAALELLLQYVDEGADR